MSDQYCPVCEKTTRSCLTERNGVHMCRKCGNRYDMLNQEIIDKRLEQIRKKGHNWEK